MFREKKQNQRLVNLKAKTLRPSSMLRVGKGRAKD
jgi:hypothetical protein